MGYWRNKTWIFEIYIYVYIYIYMYIVFFLLAANCLNCLDWCLRGRSNFAQLLGLKNIPLVAAFNSRGEAVDVKGLQFVKTRMKDPKGMLLFTHVLATPVEVWVGCVGLAILAKLAFGSRKDSECIVVSYSTFRLETKPYRYKINWRNCEAQYDESSSSELGEVRLHFHLYCTKTKPGYLIQFLFCWDEPVLEFVRSCVWEVIFFFEKPIKDAWIYQELKING